MKLSVLAHLHVLSQIVAECCPSPMHNPKLLQEAQHVA
jgi:hypothetical protein